MGSSYIACEQATIYNNLGSDVHLYVRSVSRPIMSLITNTNLSSLVPIFCQRHGDRLNFESH